MPARKRCGGPASVRVARNIRRIRRASEITTYQLAAAVTGLGVPLDASAVTRIENLGRSVNPDELTAFALALGVTPNHLLMPEREPFAGPGECQLTPALTATPADALAWAAGDARLPGAIANPGRLARRSVPHQASAS